jgi:hypothetical protein
LPWFPAGTRLRGAGLLATALVVAAGCANVSASRRPEVAPHDAGLAETGATHDGLPPSSVLADGGFPEGAADGAADATAIADAAPVVALVEPEQPDEWFARLHVARPRGMVECLRPLRITEPPLDAIACTAVVQDIPETGGTITRVQKTVVFVVEGRMLRRALEVTSHIREMYADPSRVVDLSFEVSSDGRSIDFEIDPACADFLDPEVPVTPRMRALIRGVCKNAGSYVWEHGGFRRRL